VPRLTVVPKPAERRSCCLGNSAPLQKLFASATKLLCRSCCLGNCAPLQKLLPRQLCSSVKVSAEYKKGSSAVFNYACQLFPLTTTSVAQNTDLQRRMGKDVEGSDSGIACGFIAVLFEGHTRFMKTLQDRVPAEIRTRRLSNTSWKRSHLKQFLRSSSWTSWDNSACEVPAERGSTLYHLRSGVH
jgi:hypothetical protein